jgi:hypothetical protein
MSVEFNEGNEQFHFKSPVILGVPATPKIITLIMKTGIIKDEKKAVLLIVISIVLFITMSLLIIGSVVREEKIEYNLSPNVIKQLPLETQKKIYETKK